MGDKGKKNKKKKKKIKEKVTKKKRQTCSVEKVFKTSSVSV
jgi:hypothetical protein